MQIINLRQTTTRTTRTTTAVTTIRMEPSIRSGSSMEATSASTTADDGARQLPQVHAEEPFLYYLPKGVHPTYRPLPLLVKAVAVFLSMWTSAVTTWQRLTWLQPLAILRGWRSPPTAMEVLGFATKTLLLTLFSNIVLQDLFLPPSRLSIETLQNQYFLPSPLSKYETIAVPLNNHTCNLGVHYLQFPNTAPSTPPRFDALYVHHGFGASSLSWLPALPSLVQSLGAKVGLGHDAVGFGFTNRPDDDDDMQWYTTEASARIATTLLQQQQQQPQKAVAILGHSLGGLTALKMALQLPKETSKFVLLTAPALGIRKKPSSSHKKKKRDPSWLRRKAWNPVGSLFQKAVIYPVSGFVLRRIVGAKNSWKLGLQSAWGDPNKVRDSDVLRFQWPSIGAGWERGLLRFAQAQGNVHNALDDATLLKRVLELPNTTVAIILGSKDKVISSKLIRTFLHDNDFEEQVPVIELEGLGHDAFEEDVDAFVDAVEQLLSAWNQTSV